MEDDKYSFTIYYKGEKESPIKSGNYSLYWWYEKCYFLQNNKPNEKEFKEYMLSAIDKISENFMSFDKALKDYFNIEKQRNCR